MSKTILVPLDGSVESLGAMRFAVELALACGASLDLVTVAELPPAGEDGFVLEDIDARRTAAHGEAVLEPARALVPPGISLSARVLRGRPVEALLDLIGAEQPWMVVMGRTGKGRLARALQGSVSRDVVARCPVPVTVVGGAPRG